MTMVFEQLPKESAKAFAAFRAYLGLGPERSLAAAAAKLGKSKVMMERWSRKFDWTARVLAHAAHLAELERLAIQGVVEQKAVEWEKKHEAVRREAWQEAEQAIALVREARERWLKTGRVPGFEGMSRMLELAFKLKQFASGMASEIKEVKNTLTATVDVEWEIAIRKAYGLPEPEATSTPPAVVDVQEVGGKGEVKGEEVRLLTSAATGGKQ
jgi:hypothetical protein